MPTNCWGFFTIHNSIAISRNTEYFLFSKNHHFTFWTLFDFCYDFFSSDFTAVLSTNPTLCFTFDKIPSNTYLN